MFRVGGANKGVVTDPEGIPGGFPDGRHLIRVGLRVLASFFGRLDCFLTIFVGPGAKKHLLALKSIITSNDVGGHGRVSASNVRLAVYVINWCSNKKFR